jgi:hypothetical protein
MHLLDSNILIYASQPGNEFLDAWVMAEDTQISAISIPEVLGFTGLTAEDETIFEAWLARLSIQTVTEQILRRAAALRRQRRMKLGDSIIAATALETGADLVTRNVADFQHIDGLKLIDPFSRP